MKFIYDITAASAVRTMVSGVLIYAIVIAAVRMNGLRTFAKMSGYDFAATVAVGSIVGSVALTKAVSVLEGLIALVGIVGSQRIITELRSRTRAGRAIDNPAVLVVAHGEVLNDLLTRSGMSEDDLWSTLRVAGLGRIDDATAVIFEPTGERSVLTGPVTDFDPRMFERVDGSEHLSLQTD